MAETNNKKIMEARLGYGPGQLASVTDEIIDLLEKRLLEKERQGGASALQDVLTSFRARQDEDFQDIVNDGWKKLSKASEEVYWAKMRTQPFERLMVNNFAHLLTPFGDIPKQGLSLSRRIIPAYSAFLKQMLGPELMVEYEKRAKELLQDTAHKSEGGIVDWPAMVKGPIALSIINDVLVYMAQFFDDVSRRMNWMVDFFGSNLAKATSDAEQLWRFDDEACIQLVGALYHNIFRLLENEEALELLEKRYGRELLELLHKMHSGYADVVLSA